MAMANELDHHHLVALMSHAVMDNQNVSPRPLDTAFSRHEYGIADNSETHFRTFPILDAIANISVSRDKSEVVAAALQLNSQTQEIRITLAHNQGVEDRLVCHLTNIWRKLQALSDEYAKLRVAELDEHRVATPDTPPMVARSLRIEIFRAIYQYCWGKQLKRVRKWHEGLRRLISQLFKQRAGVALEGFELNLCNAVYALSLAQDSLYRHHKNPGIPLTQEEWEMAYSQSVMANDDLKLALADSHGFGCDILAMELKDYCPGGLPFRLRHALEKLTSLFHHIECLYEFAYSARLRPALQYRIFISSVPNQTRTVKLPTSQEEWNSFLEAAYGRGCDWQGNDAARLSRRFGYNEWVCSIHCECRLIQHLRTQQHNELDDVPPFSYVAVSKLSCSACHIWIEAFNELSGTDFYTRASLGKWLWPWGIPIGEGSLEKKIAKKVLDKYFAHRVKGKHWRTGSPSSGTTLNNPSRADKHFYKARIAAIWPDFESRIEEYFATGFPDP
ncbi:hypothetical protein HOY82DRAFT_630992 [Tuber indicum]|nr:hypothetical protein HOY82DRAFT_630992 [Tuber indicum]